MKLHRIRAIARKEFLHVFRDPRSLGMGIAIPLLLLFLFGYALTLDVDRVSLMVWDRSDTPASRDFVSRFAGSRYFVLHGRATSYREIECAIDTRSTLVAMVIPHDFAEKLGKLQEAPVQILIDGTDSNTATIALGYAEAVAAEWSRSVTISRAVTQGGRPPPQLVDLRTRVWYNSDMASKNYIFPGLIAVIMMVITALLTSLTVAREWETETMEQLIATPVQGPEIIIGKLVPYFVIGLLDLVLSVMVGRFLFDVPLRGNLWLLLGLSVIFLISALSIGMLISIVTKAQLLASQLALVVTMLPSFLLSGFMFPIESMPAPLQVITHIISARYLVIILRGIYLKDVGLDVLYGEAAVLTLFGAVVITVAILKFRKKID